MSKDERIGPINPVYDLKVEHRLYEYPPNGGRLERIYDGGK